MAETTVIDGSGKKNLGKRKRALIPELTMEERETRVAALQSEIGGLLRYYKDGLGERMNLVWGEGSSVNWAIVCLLEERGVSLSKLVDEIYDKVKGREGVTVASVKSSVLLLGQRISYGVPNADADVLEDEREDALWCWETRDLKLMPKSVRGAIKNRRACKEKIHERIVAICEMIAVLQKSEDNQSSGHDLRKATKMLDKALCESDIRLLHQRLEQKDDANMFGMKAKKEQKELMKQLEKSKREAEKEKKRLDRELEKEKKQNEKELKRLQDEAEKEEKRREKEESELKKLIQRQEEEAEKEQRRKEKEEAEKKKLLAMQKQASLMERFLKKSKTGSSCQNDQYSAKITMSDSPSHTVDRIPEPVTRSLDYALSENESFSAEEIRKSHLSSWRSLGREIRGNGKQHWGIRKVPKTDVIKELKLSADKGLNGEDLCLESLNDGCSERKKDGRISDAKGVSPVSSSQKKYRHKQLLQFDKSHRPAFYGIWPKDRVIGPRHPFKIDPDLDYDIDSDEEWEEEEPGESLSDCDKDDDEESLEEGNAKVDEEDESEDDFFVPDGYLSESEGVEVERKAVDIVMEDTVDSPGLKQEDESDEIGLLFRQQKQLNSWTEHALRKNKPLIIVNITHEKVSYLAAEELTGTAKLEQTCLQALSMRAFPGFPSIKISTSSNSTECQDTSTSDNKNHSTSVTTTKSLTESDLPQIVSIIQVCPQGISKILESLQQKFPSVPKYLLRNKVREISDFVDNRWQVKKEILGKLGLSISPEKGGRKAKTIASFFSKRCLPPGNSKGMNLTETSPLSPQKPATASVETQPVCSNIQ